MDVNSGVDVVEQVPAEMVGVFVDDKVIAAVPAPVGADSPVPGRDFEIEAARKPETMMVAIDPDNVVAEARAGMREVTVLEGMVEMESRIAGCFVGVPVIVIDVRRTVDAPASNCSTGGRVVKCLSSSSLVQWMVDTFIPFVEMRVGAGTVWG
jgi:hypothetical protein